MFESLFTYFCSQAIYAHFLLFGLLLLGGINIPISMDLVVIMGGIIVSLCVPEHYLMMLVWLYLGCLMAAYEAYWLGRVVGPKLYGIPYLSYFINPTRVATLRDYIERFGIFTFVIVRFIPGGVRNGFFITSGLSGIPFPAFAFKDAFAAIFSTLALFHLGFFFGENHGVLFSYVQMCNQLILILLGSAITILVLYLRYWRTSHS